MTTERTPRIVAIIAAFNEADILQSCIAALLDQGVESYVLDDGSTDGTPDLLTPLIGNGLIAVERFPPSPTFDLTRILRRKQALTHELDADWFINHDADEFRESPWPGVTLRDAVARVEAAGYNAIDFALLDFWPTADPATPSATEDRTVVDGLTHFEYGQPFNRRQIRCWRSQDTPVDLVGSAGHDVGFPGRRVFPLRFLLRHYPIRSDEHGRRKVWQERVPRFAAEERALGWHVQYDTLQRGASSFARAASTLEKFDPAHSRLALAVDDVAAMHAALDRETEESKTLRARAAGLQQEFDALVSHVGDTLAPALASAEANVQQLQSALTALRRESARERASHLEAEALTRQQLDRLNAAIADTTAALLAAQAEAARSNAALGSERDARAKLEHDATAVWRELQGVYSSRTWRWTGPLRWLAGLLMPGRRA